MRMIAGILSLALLTWVEAASAQKMYSLSVSRHRAVPPLSEPDVKGILANASRMLKKNSRHSDDDDVACNVTFRLQAPVGVFGSTGSTAVVDEDNIHAVHHVDSEVAGVDIHVKVVEAIKFCRPGLDGPFEGCAFSPPDFRSLIVVHPKLHTVPRGQRFPDHLLWAHEFGHLTGLGHRRDRLALMTPCSLTEFSNLPDTRVQVNRAECRCLLSGPGSCPLPGPVSCR